MQTPPQQSPSIPPSFSLFQKMLGWVSIGLFLIGIGGLAIGQLMNNLPVGSVGLLIIGAEIALIGIYSFTQGKRYILTGIAALFFAFLVVYFALITFHGGQYGSPPEP